MKKTNNHGNSLVNEGDRMKYEYLLHLADNALILGQRNAEWCGQGPVIEEDIAMANISLDLIGQARMLYQYAATLRADEVTEDTLAYFRHEREFRNYTLLELPHHIAYSSYMTTDKDYAYTIVRNYLYSTLMVLLWNELSDSNDETLKAIAEKSIKEAQYHLRHSSGWLQRLGDGTEESHQKMQSALDALFHYTQEFWQDADFETAANLEGFGVLPSTLKASWEEAVSTTVTASTLTLPEATGFITQGKVCYHSEYLGPLLAEMQYVVRSYPDGNW